MPDGLLPKVLHLFAIIGKCGLCDFAAHSDKVVEEDYAIPRVIDADGAH